MKIILAFLSVFLLSGCTVYRVQTERDVDGIVSVKANIYSSRSFTAPNLAYEREGTDASFQFSADDVSQPGPQDYANAIATGVMAGMAVRPQDDEQ